MLRRESTWILMTVMGHDCAIQCEERLSAADCGANNYFHLGGKKLNLNRLPDGRLDRLKPMGWGHAKPKDWEPFVRQALLLGAL